MTIPLLPKVISKACEQISHKNSLCLRHPRVCPSGWKGVENHEVTSTFSIHGKSTRWFLLICLSLGGQSYLVIVLVEGRRYHMELVKTERSKRNLLVGETLEVAKKDKREIQKTLEKRGDREVELE
ncbi:hypothetical protein H5410_047559 [Solanum commersonii]|uniref:Uncharacterized protein n=1 Tax=Solanum commersonii TaxID=4109 RepID=A0A9J5XHC8_SOLCO|nr:hypothetical protein H5410_047559 [Solanum commersonii]